MRPQYSHPELLFQAAKRRLTKTNHVFNDRLYLVSTYDTMGLHVAWITCHCQWPDPTEVTGRLGATLGCKPPPGDFLHNVYYIHAYACIYVEYLHWLLFHSLHTSPDGGSCLHPMLLVAAPLWNPSCLSVRSPCNGQLFVVCDFAKHSSHCEFLRDFPVEQTE